jgi:hypothetical protein
MLQAPRYVSMIISHIVPVTDIKRSWSQLPFAAVLFVMLFGSAGSAQTDTPRVLFLSHFAGSTVTQHAIEAGMEEVLRDGFVNVTFEFLDFGLLERIDERPVPWEDVLRIKHADTQFDVIVGYGARASEVAEDIRDSLGGPPILHVHSNPITDSLAQGDAGLSFVFDVEGNVSPILELADPERVILVAEMRNEADRRRLEKIRSAYDAHGFAGEIDVWSGRPMDVVLDDAANADEGTVIHYLAMFTDTAGRAIEPNRAAARILTNPIYRGLIKHKEKTWPGQHEAIIEEPLWEEVQARLMAASTRRRGTLTNTPQRSTTGSARFSASAGTKPEIRSPPRIPNATESGSGTTSQIDF